MAVDETGKHEPGWRFDPFDEEVINDYLMPKILGNQLPRNYLVSNAQVYGPASNPWQVFHPDHHSWLKSKTTHRYMFVFAKLSKLSASDTSKNTSKKAGCGTWVGKTSRKKILDHQGNLIGESRYLVFQVNDTDPAALGLGVDLTKVGYYTMHEYRLSGINEALNSADTVVVCKITHDPSKRPAFALKSAIKIANCLSTSTGEAQIKQENNSSLGATGCLTTENPTEIDVGVCDNLDERKTFTSKNLNLMDNGVGDNFEKRGTLTSGSLAGIHSDVGIKIANCVSRSTSGAQIEEENNSLEGAGNLKTENPIVIDGCAGNNLDERMAFTSTNLILMGNHCVSKSTSEAHTKEGNNNNIGGTGSLTKEYPSQIDVGVCDNLDERRACTSKNLILLDSGVSNNLEESRTVNSESLSVINTDVGEWCVAPQYAPQFNNNPWDGFGEDFCFDDLGGGHSILADLDVFTDDFIPTKSIVACLNSYHKEEPVENKLGKRKFEASENSCPT